MELNTLTQRIRLAHRRLTHGEVPRFTEEFILADVALDPNRPRRFSEFSGDLSGRYIEAVTLLPPRNNPIDLHRLVRRVISFQRRDGRFGNEKLSFTAGKIGGEHMPLLWGNGRLLVGLLEYASRYSNENALRAGRRLGDFQLLLRSQCCRPAVAKRLAGMGAYGFICFTQWIEPLVLLFRQTGDSRYRDAARRMVEWLPPRGQQHSHGYLTTLRGITLLYETTREASLLSLVQKRYREIVRSPDYLICGGVPEFFGQEEVAHPERFVCSGRNVRDEGCSEADFVRLSLQLWRATGDADYLERAERCLMNHLFFNQCDTGDFGSRRLCRPGFQPTDNIARCWWCCTMHALRAFKDVLDAAVTSNGKTCRVNLFVDGRWAGDRFTMTLRQASWVTVRTPSWSDNVAVRVRGRKIEIQFVPRVRLRKRDGGTLKLKQLGRKPTEAAFFYGPWLLGVQERDEPLFFGEPWVENALLIPGNWKPARGFRFQYVHGGFSGTQPVTLQPIGARTSGEPGITAFWLRYKHEN